MGSQGFRPNPNLAVGAEPRGEYVQDKVREGGTVKRSRSQPGLPGTGREGALGYERYFAMEHMAGIVPYNPLHFLLPWRSDVRRDCSSFVCCLKKFAAGARLLQTSMP